MIARALLAVGWLATLASAAPIPGRIAFVGTDHQVYVADPNGGDPRPLTRGEEPGRVTSIRPVAATQGDSPSEGAMRFSYPNFSPDGKSLLVHGARMRGEAVERAGVYRLDLDRPGVVAPLYEDPRRAPIYTFWDPTGHRAAVLVNDGPRLALGLIEPGQSTFRVLGSGLPFYFDWRKDGRALITHVGGSAREAAGASVRLIDLAAGAPDEEPRIREISGRPAGFRAPAWTADGSHFAYARFEEKGGRASLVVQGRDGAPDAKVAPVSGVLAFSWTADSRSLAVAEAAAPASPLYAGINLVRRSDGRREPLYAGPLGAFFWSPDGKRMLVLAPDFDTSEWRWLLVERADRSVREMMRFLPSPDFQMVVLHFDQYALSHRLWAPDSRHFVFSSYSSGAQDVPGVPMVWIVDTQAASVRQIAAGRSAFWSPR